MGCVYLIGETGNEGVYKIGSTHSDNADCRLKSLQTGNSDELFVKKAHVTDSPFKMEKMLHMRFDIANLIGEWFELTPEQVDGFDDLCDNLQSLIDSMDGNPFYKKT